MGILETIAGAMRDMHSFADDFKGTMTGAQDDITSKVYEAMPEPLQNTYDFLSKDRGSVNLGVEYGGEVGSVAVPDALQQMRGVMTQASILNPSFSQLQPAPAMPDVQIPTLPTFSPAAPETDPYTGMLEGVDTLEADVPEEYKVKGILEDNLKD